MRINTANPTTRRAATAALKAEGTRGSCDISFVSEEEIRALNLQWRGVDSVTDVLSFPSGEEDFLGDVIICEPVAVRQAEEYGHTVERELAFLTVHSVLHLLGYDHIDERDGDKMRAREKIIMEKLGILR